MSGKEVMMTRKPAPRPLEGESWEDLFKRLEGVELAAAKLRRALSRRSKDKAWGDLAEGVRTLGLLPDVRPTSLAAIKERALETLERHNYIYA